MAYASLKDWQVYNIYADEGISGKDIEGRPAIKRLIADVSSGIIKNVLVYKIDRLTRSTKNLIELVDLFNQNRCGFNSVVESIDTNSATGRMFLKIVGIFAEFERENLAERVRFGFERKAKEGYSLCSYVSSYGYNRTNGEKIQEIESEEAEIVRRIFKMYLHDDYNLTQIARVLNLEGISSKRNKKWSDRTIKLVLTNPNYVGKVRYSINDTARYFENDGQHEPIVDENTFYQTQDKIGKIKYLTRTKRPTSDVYFCGILYCPICGGKYTSHWIYREGKKRAYAAYRCRANVKNYWNGEPECTSKTISHRQLEKAFEEYIIQIDDFTEIDNAVFSEDTIKTDNNAEITVINTEIGQINKKTEEIMSLFVSNDIDFGVYQSMVKISNQRRVELETRLNLLKSAEEAKTTIHYKTEIMANLKQSWHSLNNEQRLQFTQKFIKKIVAHSEIPIGRKTKEVIIDDVIFNEF